MSESEIERLRALLTHVGPVTGQEGDNLVWDRLHSSSNGERYTDDPVAFCNTLIHRDLIVVALNALPQLLNRLESAEAVVRAAEEYRELLCTRVADGSPFYLAQADLDAALAKHRGDSHE